MHHRKTQTPTDVTEVNLIKIQSDFYIRVNQYTSQSRYEPKIRGDFVLNYEQMFDIRARVVKCRSVKRLATFAHSLALPVPLPTSPLSLGLFRITHLPRLHVCVCVATSFFSSFAMSAKDRFEKKKLMISMAQKHEIIKKARAWC